MKNLFIAVLVFVVLAIATTGSFAQPGKISFGIGADAALPMDSFFKDAWSFGFGGTARGYYMFNDMVSFTATAGYMTFPGKDVTVSAGGAAAKFTQGNLSMIPVLVGARYYFSPAESKFRPYGAFEFGMVFSSYSQPSQQVNVVVGGVVVGTTGTPAVSASGSDFSYQPQIGFEASKFDVGVRYLGISNFSAVAFRVGYIFN